MTSILGHLLCLVFLLLGLIKIVENLTTTSVQKIWFLGHVLQITPEEHIAECSIKSLKIIDQIGDASTWLQINDDIIHGLPSTEGRYLFTILIFGAPFGNYIKLCHSIQYELRILKLSSKSIQSYISASNLTKKDEDARLHILTVILPTDKRDDLLDIGEDLSRDIGLPLHSLQVLSENHPHAFYKQLHSLEVVSSDVSEISLNNETLFSWVIPTNVYNHTEILKKLKHSQQNHRKRRDIGSNFQWHLVRGHIRVKREIFFGSVSALVGTPIESSTLQAPSESSVQTSLYMTSSFLDSDSIPSQTLSMNSSIMALTSEHLSPSESSISSLLLGTVVVSSGKEPDPTIITDFFTSIEPSFTNTLSSTSMPTSVLSKNPSTNIISDSSFRFSTTQTISTDFTLDTSSSISPSMHSDFLSTPINTMSTLRNFSFSSQFSKPISNIQINTSTYKSEPLSTLISSAVVSSSISTGIVSSEFDSTSSFSSSLESINDNSITSQFSSTINSLSSIHSNISYSVTDFSKIFTESFSTSHTHSSMILTDTLFSTIETSFIFSSNTTLLQLSSFIISENLTSNSAPETTNIFQTSDNLETLLLLTSVYSTAISSTYIQSSTGKESRTSIVNYLSNASSNVHQITPSTSHLPDLVSTENFFSSLMTSNAIESETSLSHLLQPSSSLANQIAFSSNIIKPSTNQISSSDHVIEPSTSLIEHSSTDEIISPSSSLANLVSSSNRVIETSTPLANQISSTERVIKPTSSSANQISSSNIFTTTTPVPNSPPIVTNIIDTLFFDSGKMTLFEIPENIFFDSEDGGTRNLTLSCFTETENSFTIIWLEFNSTTQTLSAFPLSYDYDNQDQSQLIHVRAYDSNGLHTTTQFRVAITAPLKSVSYLISMKLLLDFQTFVNSHSMRFGLMNRVLQFYGEDVTDSSLYFHSVTNGSTILEFNNASIATSNLCDRTLIDQNVEVVKQPNTNSAQKSFKDSLAPEFPIVDMDLKYSGVCITSPTPAPIGTGVDDNKYLEYLIPIIVLIIILIIVIIIVCIVFRRQRNKRTFYVGSRRYEKGQPVLFPDELELQAPPKKRQPPEEDLRLGAYDGPYDNTSLDIPDYGARGAKALSISSDDDSLDSFYKAPSESPPAYVAPPPYRFPYDGHSSEI